MSEKDFVFIWRCNPQGYPQKLWIDVRVAKSLCHESRLARKTNRPRREKYFRAIAFGLLNWQQRRAMRVLISFIRLFRFAVLLHGALVGEISNCARFNKVSSTSAVSSCPEMVRDAGLTGRRLQLLIVNQRGEFAGIVERKRFGW